MKKLKQLILGAIVIFAGSASAQNTVLNIPEDGLFTASILRAGVGGVASTVNLSTSLGSTTRSYSLVAANDQGVINVNGGRYTGNLLVNNGGRIKIDDFAEIPENFSDIEIRPTGEMVIEFGMIDRAIFNEGTLTIFAGNFGNKTIFLESGSFADITGGSFMLPSNPLASKEPRSRPGRISSEAT